MKEISLKIKRESTEGQVAPEMPKESYPSFTIYDKAPETLTAFEIGTELTAKIKVTSKEIHEGDKTRKSIGFDVICIMVNDNKGKKIHKSNATEYME